MNENMNKNMKDNVLQQISKNNIPFILLIIVLIIITFIVIINDYISFSKNKDEGFDVPSNIPSNIPSNVPPNVPSNIPSNVPPNVRPNLPPNIVDQLPDKYKKYYNNNEYNKINQEISKINNELSSIKNFNLGNEINQYIEDYKNKIKNEISSTLHEEKNKITSSAPNVNISIPGTNNPKVSNTIIILSFIFIVLLLSFIFLPSFKEFKSLFSQISNVTYVVLYTIFTILFFRLMPSNILNNSASFIVPVTIVIAVILFFMSFQSNYVHNFNVNYERIKVIILYFCFITLCITYYSTNPGNFITNNFNISLLLTTLLGVFGFIYLIVVLTLPTNYTSSKTSANAIENISSFSKYGGILFILFLVIMTVVITTYPGGFFNNKTSSSIILSLFLIISVIWSILLVVNMFNGFNSNHPSGFMDTNITYAKKTLLALLGFTISGIVIAYIVYSLQHLSSKSGIISFILSIFLIISILILIYKTIFVKLPSNSANKAKGGFFDLIVNLIFYIPCLFSGVFDFIMKTGVSEYNSNTTGNVLILFITILLLLLYIFLPNIEQAVNLQGGKQLVENPVYTNTLYPLANYEQLNGNDNFDYQYAISFWVFLDSFGPNSSSSHNEYTSVLNFGGKPNVLYKGSTNTLMITMDQIKLLEKTKNRLLEFDDNGNRIIYTNKNMLLQKWNNIIINYNGGTLDVFLNGELVKSSIEVIPYMKLDALTIGSDGGVNGGICNVVYYKKPLTMTKVYYIYNNVKNKTPPVNNRSNKTIIPLE